MIIGISGRKRVGKDTIADYLVQYYGFIKLDISDPLKDVCRILFDFSEDQLYGDSKEIFDPKLGTSPREIFQYLGTDILLKDINRIAPLLEENLFVNKIIRGVTNIFDVNPNARIVICGLRKPNEIDKLSALPYCVKMIGVKKKHNNIETLSELHEAEKYADNLITDYQIKNNSTIQDLYKKIDNIIDETLCLKK